MILPRIKINGILYTLYIKLDIVLISIFVLKTANKHKYFNLEWKKKPSQKTKNVPITTKSKSECCIICEKVTEDQKCYLGNGER